MNHTPLKLCAFAKLRFAFRVAPQPRSASQATVPPQIEKQVVKPTCFSGARNGLTNPALRRNFHENKVDPAQSNQMLSHLSGFCVILSTIEISGRENPSAYFWCEKRDLNPYGVNHTPLKRARLPVPPLSHLRRSVSDVYYYTRNNQFVKCFFEFFQKKFSVIICMH